MADETGGREVEIKSEKNLEGAFALISEELRSQFVLGYYPDQHQARRDLSQNQGRRGAAGYRRFWRAKATTLLRNNLDSDGRESCADPSSW